MDEQRFRLLADETFERILDAFENIDADDAEVEVSGGVINITFRGGERVVINTQGAVRQIWLAGGRSGWHFDYDADGERWLHDKGSGDELLGVLARLTEDAVGVVLEFSP